MKKANRGKVLAYVVTTAPHQHFRVQDHLCRLDVRDEASLQSSTFSLCTPHSRRRWSGWSRAPTPAARRRSSIRLSSTAHGCSPASCPTSSRTLTGEASSGPRCLELEGPRYDSGARIPRGGQFISCLFALLGIALKRHKFEVIVLCSGSGL